MALLNGSAHLLCRRVLPNGSAEWRLLLMALRSMGAAQALPVGGRRRSVRDVPGSFRFVQESQVKSSQAKPNQVKSSPYVSVGVRPSVLRC